MGIFFFFFKLDTSTTVFSQKPYAHPFAWGGGGGGRSEVEEFCRIIILATRPV